jgi:hypothetical protein
MFRQLHADEIDVRIANVKSDGKGFSLLLYKDARCDMNILDETVGAMDWQRQHSRDNKNCIVSIWCGTKEQWISKEDTGTESNTEQAKGLASDSFKRACFNWGIGRELYTAPFIWIKANEKETYKTNRTKNNGDAIYAVSPKVKFSVSKIVCNAKHQITELIIKDKNENIRFNMKDNKQNTLVEKPQNTSEQQQINNKSNSKNYLIQLIEVYFAKNKVEEISILQELNIKSWDEVPNDRIQTTINWLKNKKNIDVMKLANIANKTFTDEIKKDTKIDFDL